MATPPPSLTPSSPLQAHADSGAPNAIDHSPGGCNVHDVSLWPRGALRGSGAAQLLLEQGYRPPQAPNTALAADHQRWVMRMGKNEYWLLGCEPAATTMFNLTDRPDVYTYPLQFSHCWIMLTGAQKHRAMAKLCAVDLRPESFPEGRICQSSVARVNTAILHHRCGQRPVYSLLCDSSYSEYLWQEVNAAAEEFNQYPATTQNHQESAANP